MHISLSVYQAIVCFYSHFSKIKLQTHHGHFWAAASSILERIYKHRVQQ